MSEDTNGFRVKPGHEQSASLNMGSGVWLLKRCDEKLYGYWQPRHDAIGARLSIPNAKPEWFEPVQVPAGSVRMKDVVDISQ